jgi:hypothetical protein
MLTVTSGLDYLLNKCSLMIIIYVIHYSCLHDHMVIWAHAKFVTLN